MHIAISFRRHQCNQPAKKDKRDLDSGIRSIQPSNTFDRVGGIKTIECGYVSELKGQYELYLNHLRTRVASGYSIRFAFW